MCYRVQNKGSHSFLVVARLVAEHATACQIDRLCRESHIFAAESRAAGQWGQRRWAATYPRDSFIVRHVFNSTTVQLRVKITRFVDVVS